MSLGDLFVCTAALEGGPGQSKAEVVGRLVTLLAEAGHVPSAEVPAVLRGVLRREMLGTTAIGRGLAVPHTSHPTVSRPLCVLATCRPPVEFESFDGEPVDLVALRLFPPNRPGQHLGLASPGPEGLYRQVADADFCRRLRQARAGELSDGSISDAEKVERMKWINEILHRATAKVYVLRLKTHEWTEEDFGSLVRGYADGHEEIKKEVLAAVNRSYRAVTGQEMG